jgi:exodeoxyribonuclease-3
MKISSWNVNGIRAVYKKGFVSCFKELSPDILCIQETKASKEQVPTELMELEGYYKYFVSARKKGYSGVAVFTKRKPKSVQEGLGIEKFDVEGRTIVLEFDEFTLINIYYPNGKARKERLEYKMEFYDAFLEFAESLRKTGKSLVVCGDVNTAHKEIDLARPKQNEKVSGFLPEEREWIDKFLSKGYVDTFREFNKEGGNYSWWDYKSGARKRNVGWRIDYFFISDNLKNNLKNAFILPEVFGSDHCPVGIELEF